MKTWRRVLIFLTVPASVFFLAGCDHDHDAEHGHQHETEHAHAHGGDDHDEAGVTFKEGRGLRFSGEVLHELALKTEVANVRELVAEHSVTAQVFATGPRVLASALVPGNRAAIYENADCVGAKLLRVDRTANKATRLVEFVFECDKLPSRTKTAAGDFVTVSFAGAPRAALAVPRAAVLESATGNFVYKVNGDSYLRVPVETGTRSTGHIEIVGGLRAGDVVVTSLVEQLWLAELRLTKGGGHSH